MHKFFYGFEGLSLNPGNKTAGFNAFVSTPVMQMLVNTPAELKVYTELMEMTHRRLQLAKLMPAKVVTRAAIGMVDRSMCPRFFSTDPVFGGSVGAEPGEIERLPRADALEWIGPSLTFSPHNVDSSNQALALMLMVQTWSEWVRMCLPDEELLHG
jgi:hypothetical protein